MAFDRHAAQQEQGSGGAWKQKKKRTPESEETRLSSGESVYDEYDAFDEETEEEGSDRKERGAGSRRRILLTLFCLVLIGAGFALMYADMNRTFRHGIYRAEDGRMMEAPAEPDSGKTAELSAAINELAEKYPDVQQYMMLVPSAACIQPSWLPDGAQVRDQKADLAQIRAAMPAGLHWVDLAGVFLDHTGEKLYYSSDIYLTGWGSRYAARTAMTAMEVEIPEEKDTCYLLSNTFAGRLAKDRKPGLNLLEKKGERLEIYVPDGEAYYYRTDLQSGDWSGSLYDSGAAQSDQAYDVFFGGERALTEIHTTRINGETLLVIGDRTADSIVPLFVSSFEHIYYMHPSKCTKTIDKLIKKYSPTKILYLYGANEYMADRTLLRALQK